MDNNPIEQMTEKEIEAEMETLKPLVLPLQAFNPNVPAQPITSQLLTRYQDLDARRKQLLEKRLDSFRK